MSVLRVLIISRTPRPLMADTINTRLGRGRPACFNLEGERKGKQGRWRGGGVGVGSQWHAKGLATAPELQA